MSAERDRTAKAEEMTPEIDGTDYAVRHGECIEKWWDEDYEKERDAPVFSLLFFTQSDDPVEFVRSQVTWLQRRDALLSSRPDAVDRFRSFFSAQCTHRAELLRAHGAAARERFASLRERARFDPRFGVQLELAQGALSVSLTALPTHLLARVFALLSDRDRAVVACASSECRAAVALVKTERTRARTDTQPLVDVAFQVLPEDLLLQIMLQTDAQTVGALACTCRRLLHWVHREVDWRRVCLSRGWHHFGLVRAVRSLSMRVPATWQQLYFSYRYAQRHVHPHAIEPPLNTAAGELALYLCEGLEDWEDLHKPMISEDIDGAVSAFLWAHLVPLGRRRGAGGDGSESDLAVAAMGVGAGVGVAGREVSVATGDSPLSAVNLDQGYRLYGHTPNKISRYSHDGWCALCALQVPLSHAYLLPSRCSTESYVCERGHLQCVVYDMHTLLRECVVLRCSWHALMSGAVSPQQAVVQL